MLAQRQPAPGRSRCAAQLRRTEAQCSASLD